MNNKYLIVGAHGALCFGIDLTPGKESPQIGYGIGIDEGTFSRNICARLGNLSDDIEVMNPGPIRLRLMAKVNFINKLHKEEKNLILISIHANAFGDNGWNDVNGHRIFVSPTASKKSKQLAGFIDAEFRGNVYEMHRRTIKEKPFTILSKTTCPAVLVECGFMTNEKDAAGMASDSGRRVIAQAIEAAIFEFDKIK